MIWELYVINIITTSLRSIIMPFRYACFISYSSVTTELGRKIIDRLTTTLKNHLDLEIKEGVFIDKERLKPGSRYNEQLASLP